ncbi:hypothetical protein [Flavobacterium sp. WC2509]|uniref:hypothetical protein n=1 Tax=Flavobacterium sp. WC2509 TaxID=3461406 RepID=UPI0040448D35
MKLLFAIALSTLLLLPSLGNMIVYANFKINQDEISKTICVQKKLEFNTCNGRCELQKSLKQFEDNEKKMNNHLKEKTELVYVQNNTEMNHSVVIPYFSTQKNYITFDKKPISIALSNFRPPSYFI